MMSLVNELGALIIPRNWQHKLPEVNVDRSIYDLRSELPKHIDWPQLRIGPAPARWPFFVSALLLGVLTSLLFRNGRTVHAWLIGVEAPPVRVERQVRSAVDQTNNIVFRHSDLNRQD